MPARRRRPTGASLFESLDSVDPRAPLAARMRPRSLDEFAGQGHLVGEGRPLRRAITTDSVPSCDPVELFAVPAALPDGPIRLAVATGALLGFVFVSGSGLRRLRITFSDLIDLTSEPDQHHALGVARRWMATQLECAIVASPTEWLNWPLLGEMWKQGTWRARNLTS